jgi:hypothetical protein
MSDDLKSGNVPSPRSAHNLCVLPAVKKTANAVSDGDATILGCGSIAPSVVRRARIVTAHRHAPAAKWTDGCIGYLLLHSAREIWAASGKYSADYGPTPARPRQQGPRHPGDPGMARASVDHQHRGLYGAGAEKVQRFLAGLGAGAYSSLLAFKRGTRQVGRGSRTVRPREQPFRSTRTSSLFAPDAATLRRSGESHDRRSERIPWEED